MDSESTLDDIYRKFGEASEAAQIIETDLGTMLLFCDAVDAGLMINERLEVDGKRAGEILDRINRQTLGQLIKNTTSRADQLDQLEALLAGALKARNRLSHSFFREHNLRKFSVQGRAMMMEDLDAIHTALLEAIKALSLASGIDIDKLTAEIEQSRQARTLLQSEYRHFKL
jgi:hypothetical protein